MREFTAVYLLGNERGGDGSSGLAFLQVALDASDAPTYRFEPGVAKTSLARQTAERLGVTREEIGALIRSKLRSPERD